jgi:hypothetical protein
LRRHQRAHLCRSRQVFRPAPVEVALPDRGSCNNRRYSGSFQSIVTFRRRSRQVHSPALVEVAFLTLAPAPRTIPSWLINAALFSSRSRQVFRPAAVEVTLPDTGSCNRQGDHKQAREHGRVSVVCLQAVGQGVCTCPVQVALPDAGNYRHQ